MSEFSENERQKWEATEWYCVNKFLNKLLIPTKDENGREYSTVGRIVQLMKMSERNNYSELTKHPDDLIEEMIQKAIK
jgi:hypothetical protein